MTKTLAQIAEALAIDAKASGFEDMGDLFDKQDHGHLTDAEWDRVCDMAEEVKPRVIVPASVREAWAQSARDFRAEQQAERRAFA